MTTTESGRWASLSTYASGVESDGILVGSHWLYPYNASGVSSRQLSALGLSAGSSTHRSRVMKAAASVMAFGHEPVRLKKSSTNPKYSSESVVPPSGRNPFSA